MDGERAHTMRQSVCSLGELKALIPRFINERRLRVYPCSVVVSHGFDTCVAYLSTIEQILWLPYAEGWPAYPMATPHMLYHDLLLLVPVFLLLSADHEEACHLLYAAIFTYFGVLALRLLGKKSNVALFVVIPTALLVLQLKSLKTMMIGRSDGMLGQ